MAPSNEVLVVEDDVPIQQLLSAIVSRNGLHAVVAADGRSALALLDNGGDYDAVVLDLLLPETSGMEILRHVARTRPDLLGRIIVTTAAAEALYRGVEEMGSVRCLIRKPFDLQQIEGPMMACHEERKESGRRAGR
jgi:DNA-binding NtrC family response regulator